MNESIILDTFITLFVLTNVPISRKRKEEPIRALAALIRCVRLFKQEVFCVGGAKCERVCGGVPQGVLLVSKHDF